MSLNSEEANEVTILRIVWSSYAGRHCEENQWSCKLYGGSEESVKREKMLDRFMGDICAYRHFQVVYFFGEVFCLGLGFLFLYHSPPPNALYLLFVAILFKFCGFPWTSQLSSVLKVIKMPEVGDQIELFVSGFL